MTYYASVCTSVAELKPAIFYHMLKAGLIVTKVAEELIYPALPIGRVTREQVRELVLQYIPDAKTATQAKILQAIFHTYDLLAIASAANDQLRFNLHPGTLEGFLYSNQRISKSWNIFL